MPGEGSDSGDLDRLQDTLRRARFFLRHYREFAETEFSGELVERVESLEAAMTGNMLDEARRTATSICRMLLCGSGIACLLFVAERSVAATDPLLADLVEHQAARLREECLDGDSGKPAAPELLRMLLDAALAEYEIDYRNVRQLLPEDRLRSDLPPRTRRGPTRSEFPTAFLVQLAMDAFAEPPLFGRLDRLAIATTGLMKLLPTRFESMVDLGLPDPSRTRVAFTEGDLLFIGFQHESAGPQWDASVLKVPPRAMADVLYLAYGGPERSQSWIAAYDVQAFPVSMHYQGVDRHQEVEHYEEVEHRLDFEDQKEIKPPGKAIYLNLLPTQSAASAERLDHLKLAGDSPADSVKHNMMYWAFSTSSRLVEAVFSCVGNLIDTALAQFLAVVDASERLIEIWSVEVSKSESEARATTVEVRCPAFISYRRKGGWEAAELIRVVLELHQVRAFLDRTSLGPGHFPTGLFDAIRDAHSVILILTPGCLRRHGSTDWLREEVLHAKAMKKRIVPVMFNDFAFPSRVAASLEFLREIQAIRWTPRAHQGATAQLLGFLNASRG
ncbi:MAG TPA: toll/interleukin-1 receptor domain-containing protein [Thermoguttaceae bacterium]|nr:toll/interleukin-1 receptor domain-containing protein [Thermoguttaceae bacterium]